MMRRDTLWHASILALVIATGCAESNEPAPSDGGALDARSCRTDDLGRPAPCFGGPCCDEMVMPSVDPATCRYACPAGFDFSGCEVDPSALCGPAFDAPCEEPTDCELAFDTCCGTCGTPTLDDYDAILRERRDAHRDFVCPDPSTLCPGCAVAPNPSLGATCESNRCTGFDVRALPLSSCTRDEDCRLRATACCECGADTSPFALIAIRNDAESRYAALVCPSDVGCPECAPAYPAEASAYCADDGHCAVQIR